MQPLQTCQMMTMLVTSKEQLTGRWIKKTLLPRLQATLRRKNYSFVMVVQMAVHSITPLPVSACLACLNLLTRLVGLSSVSVGDPWSWSGGSVCARISFFFCSLKRMCSRAEEFATVFAQRLLHVDNCTLNGAHCMAGTAQCRTVHLWNSYNPMVSPMGNNQCYSVLRCKSPY